MLDALIKIGRDEGAAALYKGCACHLELPGQFAVAVPPHMILFIAKSCTMF